MNWGTSMKCSGASSHETFMNSKHHELGNLHEIGDPNLHGISQPKGGASGFGKNLQNSLWKTEVLRMDHRTVGLLAGYRGRRGATGWLRQILREFTGLWRSGAAHPR